DRGFGARAMSDAGSPRTKFEEAGRHGAAGALIIHETGASGFGWDQVRAAWTGPQRALAGDPVGQGLPPVEGWVSEQAARDLMAPAGQDFAVQKARAERPDFTPVPLALTGSVALESRIDTTMSRNVIGILPGRGHPQEAVVVTANWDGLGVCAPPSAS